MEGRGSFSLTCAERRLAEIISATQSRGSGRPRAIAHAAQRRSLARLSSSSCEWRTTCCRSSEAISCTQPKSPLPARHRASLRLRPQLPVALDTSTYHIVRRSPSQPVWRPSASGGRLQTAALISLMRPPLHGFTSAAPLALLLPPSKPASPGRHRIGAVQAAHSSSGRPLRSGHGFSHHGSQSKLFPRAVARG